MGRDKRISRLPAGEGFHMATGVPSYTWASAPRHGILYEHGKGGRAAGKWRPAKEAETTGYMFDGRWHDTRHAYVPAQHYAGRDDDASSDSEDADREPAASGVREVSHGTATKFDDFEGDDLDALAHEGTIHTMAWPASVGDVFGKLGAIMSRARTYDTSSADAWVASAAVAEVTVDDGNETLVHVCDHADMQKHATSPEVYERLIRMVDPLGTVARREALSILHDWAAEASREHAHYDYYDTFGIQCATGDFFVALAFAADPRHDPSADSLEVDHVMCGGFAVFIRGKDPCCITTYTLRPNPVYMHRDDGSVHTRVMTIEATVRRAVYVERELTHPSRTGEHCDAYKGQVYTLELVMVAFEDGEVPHFAAKLRLRGAAPE